MNYVFRTPDFPRKPEEGDASFTVWFPTDEGGRVTIVMGEEGFNNLCSNVTAMLNNLVEDRERKE